MEGEVIVMMSLVDFNPFAFTSRDHFTLKNQSCEQQSSTIRGDVTHLFRYGL